MGPSNYALEDSFISDDDEELCPLCVEEMDISDKNFKPCPCGYQVCQFCYNNIRQNPQLNGKCPACRRPYDDESVEYRIITPEEWKMDQAKHTRRERERKQREREKKETEQTSKKHLSGMRVIQKNLVYVIGLNPSIPTEELHHALRTDQFFGQYGKIQKIVINRRNNSDGNPGLGVYVTFARKEDAARCIAAVDGSVNDGKYLRAAYGTTKYCSAYLRGQACQNPNCMFLHEPGEEADSYTRQDLSTIQHAAGQEDSMHSSPTSKPKKPYNTDQDSVQSSSGSHVDHSDQPSSLPASVSWATKPSPSVSSTKLNLPSFPPLPVAKPALIPSVVAQSRPEPPVIPQREPSKQNLALKFMDDSLDMLTSSKFDYRFSSDLVNTQKLDTTLPLFAFSDKTNSFSSDAYTNELPSYVYTSLSLFSAPKTTRRGWASSQDINPLAHTQSTLPFSENVAKILGHTSADFRAVTSPPPGLVVNGKIGDAGIPSRLNQSLNSQKLLAHLMEKDFEGEA